MIFNTGIPTEESLEYFENLMQSFEQFCLGKSEICKV